MDNQKEKQAALKTIIGEISADRGFRTATDSFQSGRQPLLVNGICEQARAAYCVAFMEKLSKKLLIVVPDEKTVRILSESFGFFGLRVITFPSRDFVFESIRSYSKEWEHQRISVLSSVIRDDYDIIITVPDALMEPTIPKKLFSELSFTLRRGDKRDTSGLIALLSRMGYKRTGIVDGIGQYSMRGSIVDIFSPMYTKPCRIDFFGDEADTMGFFDIVSQRRGENINEFVCVPVSELLMCDEAKEKILSVMTTLCKKAQDQKRADSLSKDADELRELGTVCGMDKYSSLLYDEKQTLFDYLDNDGYITVVVESKKIAERARAFEWSHEQTLETLANNGAIKFSAAAQVMSQQSLFDALSKKCIAMDAFMGNSMSFSDRINLSTKQTIPFSLSLDVLYEDIQHFLDAGKYTLVLTSTERSRNNLLESFSEKKIPSYIFEGKLFKDAVGVSSDQSLYSFGGFETEKLALITDEDIAKKRPHAAKRRILSDSGHKGEKIASYADLTEGDLVVHVNHGIGRYAGIHNLKVEGVSKDFIKIEYAGSDCLYVPCNQLDLVNKYVGNEKAKISRLDSVEWQRAKHRAKTAAADIAKDLIALYSQRRLRKAYAFPPDDSLQTEFENLFEYPETEGQLEAVKEIKHDMESEIPMDRLLCGDVGFGKTEVAIRAIFKCVCSGKQAAILVPTTILAFQHYQTLLSRMRDFPIKVEMVSRFRAKNDQKDILSDLKRGKIDVIVGTHRLIQKDVEFRDLGLLIIDEEQRFGVTHKEKLKQLAKNVHVLTLTATPIPRTLNMALSGIRDLSVLEEAPEGRLPVQTYVLEYDEELIFEAIRKEIRRGGQVFYLHNFVETIYSKATRLSKEFPDSTIGVAHGQMSKDELSNIWASLVNGEIDILVCTTIIETGVDVPNANTLIIEGANRMGLSQLHQLRGRVGRSSRKAYAYFTYRADTILSEEASKRLEAIKEYTEFGSGFKIAMRDLELRGAGNLLGAEQHGNMEAVGYYLYIHILEEAVNEQRGIEVSPKRECNVDISVNAYIPEEYVESTQLRMDVYKKIAHIDDEGDRDDVVDELLDRFGDLPESVCNLIDIALIRNHACSLGIKQIEQKGSTITFFLSEFDPQACIGLASFKDFKGALMLSPGAKPCFTYKLDPKVSKLSAIRKILAVYAKLLQKKG